MNARSREFHAKRINDKYDDIGKYVALNGAQLATYVKEAFDELGEEEWQRMTREDLRFGHDKANGLLRIGRNVDLIKLVNSTDPNATSLGWTVCYEVAKLTGPQLRWARDHGLLDATTTARSARALQSALDPETKIVGEDVKDKAMLPSAAEARKLARETGKLVMAKDGNLYTGASREEGEEQDRRRNLVFGVRRAINALALAGDAEAFYAQMMPFERWDATEREDVFAARDFLIDLCEKL